MTVSDCQVKQVQTNHLRFESLIRKNDNSNCPLEPKQSSDSFSNFEQAIETTNVRDSQRNLCDRQVLLLLVESPIPVRSVCTSLRRPVLSKGPSVPATSLMPLLAASGRQLPVRSDCQYSSTSGLASVATRPQLAGIVFLSFQRIKKMDHDNSGEAKTKDVIQFNQSLRDGNDEINQIKHVLCKKQGFSATVV